MSLFVFDLPADFEARLKIGSTVYLVRKISGHIVECELTAIGKQGTPKAEVRWLNNGRYVYELNLERNEVIAQDATVKHRQEMRLWYTVWEPHRKALNVLFTECLRKNKKK